MSTMKKQSNNLQTSIWLTETETIHKSLSNINSRRQFSCSDQIINRNNRYLLLFIQMKIIVSLCFRYYLCKKCACYFHSWCSPCFCGLLLGCLTASIILAVFLTLWIKSSKEKTTGMINQFNENSHNIPLNTTTTIGRNFFYTITTTVMTNPKNQNDCNCCCCYF